MTKLIDSSAGSTGLSSAGAPTWGLWTVAFLLWERRRFLLRFFVAAFCLVTLIAFLLPKRYEATAQLMPPDSSSMNQAMIASVLSKGGAEGLSGFAGDLLGTKNSGAVFVAVLRSRTIQDHLIERFDLRSVYWVSKFEDARKELSDNTSITEERKSGVLTVRVRDKSSQRARDMANAYVSELDKLVRTLNTSAARREREFLEERLTVVKSELDESSKALAAFSSRSGALDLRDQSKAMLDSAARLQGQVVAAEAELRGLEQIYSPDSVRVRALRARVSELNSKLRSMVGSAEVSDAPDSLYPSLRQLPKLGVTYADLYRRARINEAVFENLTKRYELAKLEEVRETPSVKVLDAPVIPERKASPPRLLIIIFGTLLSWLAVVSYCIAKRAWEVLDDGDPRRQLINQIAGAVRRRKNRPMQFESER